MASSTGNAGCLGALIRLFKNNLTEYLFHELPILRWGIMGSVGVLKKSTIY
jgi:hypothetical protein